MEIFCVSCGRLFIYDTDDGLCAACVLVEMSQAMPDIFPEKNIVDCVQQKPSCEEFFGGAGI